MPLEPGPLIDDQFADINRYWDHRHKMLAAKILPGEFYVTGSGELISTVLGSCVAACVRDRVNGIGGMNHFMLPHVDTYEGSLPNKLLSVAGRYGNVAMERLINCILTHGGQRHRLEFKIFGGARVLDIDSEVGQRNILFISEYLRIENFETEAKDLGGSLPRKLNYFPVTGKVMVRKLRRIKGSTLGDREARYSQALSTTRTGNDVTLFNG